MRVLPSFFLFSTNDGRKTVCNATSHRKINKRRARTCAIFGFGTIMQALSTMNFGFVPFWGGGEGGGSLNNVPTTEQALIDGPSPRDGLVPIQRVLFYNPSKEHDHQLLCQIRSKQWKYTPFQSLKGLLTSWLLDGWGPPLLMPQQEPPATLHDHVFPTNFEHGYVCLKNPQDCRFTCSLGASRSTFLTRMACHTCCSVMFCTLSQNGNDPVRSWYISMPASRKHISCCLEALHII